MTNYRTIIRQELAANQELRTPSIPVKKYNRSRATAKRNRAYTASTSSNWDTEKNKVQRVKVGYTDSTPVAPTTTSGDDDLFACMF